MNPQVNLPSLSLWSECDSPADVYKHRRTDRVATVRYSAYPRVLMADPRRSACAYRSQRLRLGGRKRPRALPFFPGPTDPLAAIESIDRSLRTPVGAAEGRGACGRRGGRSDARAPAAADHPGARLPCARTHRLRRGAAAQGAPSQRIGGCRRNETAHTVAAHQLPLLVHCSTERLHWSVGTYRLS